MKKMIIALICGAMVLSFAACGSKSYTASEYSDSEVNDKVQMHIPQKTVTDETDEFTVVLENTTDQDYNYDAGQRLEVWKNSKWCVVEDKINFTTMQLFTLPAGGSDISHVTPSYVPSSTSQTITASLPRDVTA